MDTYGGSSGYLAGGGVGMIPAMGVITILL